MEKFEIIITTLFGLESLVAREVRRLGYETTSVEDGRVTFMGDNEAVCRANMWIRTGERVLIKTAEFTAVTFDEFAESLSNKYGIEWLPEDGTNYQIQFSIFKDKVTLMIDTSGEGLHKRGYRQHSNVAPLKETLAAAMVELSHWKFEYPLCDPFCGSGTIPIEAAMIKRNIAPGINREFAAQNFAWIDDELWDKSVEEAKSLERNVPLEIYAYDIENEYVELTNENARIAGVGDFVKAEKGDARKIHFDMPYGTIICNPPYGERIGEIKECEKLYKEIGKSFNALDKWSYYIIASNENFESLFGKKANKKRKLYNGMIKCNLYQFFGERPPKTNK